MRTPLLTLAAAALLFAVAAPVQSAPKEEPLAKRVNDAIKLGRDYLRDQGPKGEWEVSVNATVNFPGGVSGLALLALLNAGVPPEDPLMRKGLAYLRSVKASRTYVVSLQTMVLILAGEGFDKGQIRDNVNWLLKARGPTGWGYGSGDGNGPDDSNTQFALLALHEAKQAGYAVDPSVFEAMQKHYLGTQVKGNGGWKYRNLPNPSITMTTAGLCGLYITGMDLNKGLANLRPDGSAENCGVYAENPNIAQAIAFLSARLPSEMNENTILANRIAPLYYALYGIERTGRLSGQRYLGSHDWYRTGCEYLVSAQNANGSWRGDDIRGENSPIVSTSLALLFLAKGRTPVLLTKLAYGPPEYAGWNNKRNDMRNLTEFASRELFKKQPLAWQAFDVRNKSADGKAARRELAEELLQSPIVFLNGHDRAPADREEEILKEYVDNGGFIFAEACCGERAFDQDFHKLMKHMFPDSELTELEPEHPVWTASGKFISSPRDFPLYGILQGCKTIVIYSPKPISGYWEANLTKDGKGQKAFELAANVIAYATGLTPPKPKLTEVPIIRPDGEKANIKRGYLKVAQLKHEGTWQPAPKAMRNLMDESRKLGLDVILETKAIDPRFEEDVLSYRFFYMHGRAGFKSNSADLKALRFKLESGGLLLADACCGSPPFDAAFHKFIDELFEKKLKLEPIPLDDELFGSKLNGEKIREVRCRQTAGKDYAAVAPALQGVKYKGRWIVIYSKYDLGCALEHANTPDCLGHDYESAVKLGRAAVLYHLKR